MTTADGGDRAVSDVVAFVLTFSVVILSVGVVSGVGFSVMEEIRGDEQALNAQRAFQTLGESLNEIDRQQVPGRSGEISLSGGTLLADSGADGPAFEVRTNTGETFTTDAGRIRYRSGDDTRVLVENGAVIREDEGADQGIVVQRPNVVCEGGANPYAVVSVVKLVADVNGIGGDGTVQIVGREQSSTLLYSDDDATSVTVDYGGSEFSEAWETYFSRTGEWQSVDGTDAVCDVGGDGRVIVRRTVVEVDFVS